MSRGQLHGFNGQRLRQLRTRHRLTQRELAESIGVHEKVLYGWEVGKYLPTPGSGKKLAAWFGLELPDFLDIDYDTCLLPALRSPVGLSQNDTALALGWSRSLFSSIECGDRTTSADEQRALADLYRVEVSLVAAAAQRTIAARAAKKLQEAP